MKKLLMRLPAMLNDWKHAWHRGVGRPESRDAPLLCFRCNICGRNSQAPIARLGREEPTCRCGSTVRLRALVNILAMELYDQRLALPDFPERKDIAGIDMSGAATYASRLASKLGYTNTFLHQPPVLDITQPDEKWLESCHFVISSDVFEHVAQPVSRAFSNTFRILKPGGVFILTVPYTKHGETREHFPQLHDYRIETQAGKRTLFNITRDGISQKFSDLVFHGGEGTTLEMRVFSESGVLEELRNAGFEDIRIHREPCTEFGIVWAHDWSLPISARKPG